MSSATGTIANWATTVDHFGFVLGGATLVVGEEAGELAATLNTRGAARRVSWGRDLALLHPRETPDLREATAGSTGLPAGSLDLVVARHAWRDQASMAAVFREAFRALKPGGGLLAADLAVDELLDSTPQRYPYLLLPALVPGLAAVLTAGHVDAKRLTLEVVRAGFRAIRSYMLEDERLTFPTHEAYIDYGREGGWRGWDTLTDDQRSRVGDELPRLLERIAPLGEVRVAEPWNVTGGFKPQVRAR